MINVVGTMRSVVRKLMTGNRDDEDHDHYYGEAAKGYLAKRLKQESWHREQTIVREMLARLPDGARVLDVPFGTGRFVEMYLAKNMTVHGIDISQDMLDAAREALADKYDRCDIRQGGADALPYERNYFDVTVCFRFFGLIPMDLGQRVLAELSRVTKGDLVIRVPVRKASAPALPRPQGSDVIQGRLYEKEVREWFAQHDFHVYDRQLINEREDVEFFVYAMRRQTKAGRSHPG